MAEKEGNVSLPNWTKEPKFTRSAPSNNPPGKIPPKTEIKPFAGLPASQSPHPMKIEGGYK